MSERKVLNKYYPPDFDPSKIPKLHLARNRQYSIRIMAPFNMRCDTCGEYIYKGKKFNSRKETVEDENYLGLHIFRFYIKCPKCVAEIAFKTDPQNTDYSLEAGASRNFEAAKTAEMMARKEAEEKEAEEANNPMKVLENRTKSSQREMEMIETLEELKELNTRHAKVDHEYMIKLSSAYEEQLKRLQDEEEEEIINSIFGKKDNESVKRLQDDDDDEEEVAIPIKKTKLDKPTSILVEEDTKPRKPAVWERSVGSLGTSKSKLGLLVRKKGTASTAVVTQNGLSGAASKQDPSVTVIAKDPIQKLPATGTRTTDVQSASNGQAATSKPPTGGLSLLGSYSDSDSSEND